jgi:hypothetical protein
MTLARAWAAPLPASTAWLRSFSAPILLTGSHPFATAQCQQQLLNV